MLGFWYRFVNFGAKKSPVATMKAFAGERTSCFEGVRVTITRKVDIRLPGKGNSNPHGTRPVHQIISLIKWIRTSSLSIKNSLSVDLPDTTDATETGNESARAYQEKLFSGTGQ